MRILAGQEQPDSGVVTRSPSTLRLAYLPQGFEIDPTRTLNQVIQAVTGDPHELESELARLALDLASRPDDLAVQEAYDRVLRQMESFDPGQVGQTQLILTRLGLSDLQQDLPVGRLSGGQKTRLALALTLVSRPQLLLLDEPTNHLDIPAREALQEVLEEYNGTILLVSHDRYLINRLATRVWEIKDKQLITFNGNYRDYILRQTALRNGSEWQP